MDASPILDYASPRPRGRVRLPANSRIRIECDRTEATIIESLEGKASALAAVAFGGTMLVILGTLIVVQLQEWYQHRNSYPYEVLVLGAFWLAEAVLSVMVLAQTWRKTILRVRDGYLTLNFQGLLSPTRQHQWPIDQIGELRVVLTQEARGAPRLAELQLRPNGDVSVHLFTDHLEMDVQRVAKTLTQALAGEVCDVFEPEQTTVQQDTAPLPPDEANFNRLVQAHRQIRESDRARRLTSEAKPPEGGPP